MKHYELVEGVVLIVMGLLVFKTTIKEHLDHHDHGVKIYDVLGAVLAAGCISCGITAMILSVL